MYLAGSAVDCDNRLVLTVGKRKALARVDTNDSGWCVGVLGLVPPVLLHL